MKLLLCLLLSLTAQFAAADAEIQIFIGYKGYNNYQMKVVSTPSMPASAWYLLSDPEHNAACFMGDAEEAIQLMQTMVSIYNAEYHQNLSVAGHASIDKGTATPFLILQLINDDNGQGYTWFSHMRECIRWSTPGERSP